MVAIISGSIGDFGNVVGIHADELALLFHVGDNVVDGHLSSGTGGGGHGDGEHSVVLGGGNAFQRAHVGILGVVDDDADALGGIHGGAAADGDDAIRAGGLVGFHASLHVFNGGVGLDVVKDHVGDVFCIQQGGHLAGHAELNQIGVGADEGLLVAAGFEDAGDLGDSAFAVVGDGVEHDACSHDGFLL